MGALTKGRYSTLCGFSALLPIGIIRTPAAGSFGFLSGETFHARHPVVPYRPGTGRSHRRALHRPRNGNDLKRPEVLCGGAKVAPGGPGGFRFQNALVALTHHWTERTTHIARSRAETSTSQSARDRHVPLGCAVAAPTTLRGARDRGFSGGIPHCGTSGPASGSPMGWSHSRPPYDAVVLRDSRAALGPHGAAR